MEYKSLAGLIEPYADGPFDKLPAGLRKRVKNDFSESFCEWAELTAAGRRDMARQIDMNDDPAFANNQNAKAGLHIGYYGKVHVQTWLTLAAVSPQEAALLLFGQNPFKYKVNLPDMGNAFDLMKRKFDDTSRDGCNRNLRNWITLARELDLHGVDIDGWEACVLEVDARQLLRPRVTGVVAEIPARKRKHYLHDIFMAEQSKCSGSNDLWARLLALAKIGGSQLIGVTEKGLQYLDAHGNPQEFSKKQLDAYMNGTNLTRRRPPKGQRKSA